LTEHHVRERSEPVVPLAVSEGAQTPPPPPGPALLGALTDLRGEVDRLSLPLDVPGAQQMRQERSRVLRALDGYLLRRLRDREGPLLVVVGGPTGAGKSTLLNSLVGATLSPSGVLRPTTSSPVLLYNPADGASFLHRRLLPDVAAATVGGSLINHGEGDRELAMRLVPTDDLPPGLAILDSPDVDSRKVAHHELAADLLAVADLWLYVTTGTTYANAVPWDFLRAAADRKVRVAAVLNRIRPPEFEQVRVDLARMLCDEGLEESPLFAVPETTLVDGRIPSVLMQQLLSWLNHESGNLAARQGYVDRAMAGSLDQVLASVARLAQGAADQVVADRRLRVDLRAIFSYAREEIRDRIVAQDPAAVESIEAAWRVHAGAIPEARRPGRWRQFLGGRPPAGDPRQAIVGELAAAVLAPFRAEVTAAVRRVGERWSSHPAAGSVALDLVGVLEPDFDERARGAFDGWLADVGDLAVAARALGADVDAGAHQGTGDQALAPLRADLVARLYVLCAQEESRLATLLDGVTVSHRSGSALRAAADAVRSART
jgi:energy-coupling factor transporter ATP-binding protein EcfA2